MDDSLFVEGVNIRALTDEDLQGRLQGYGFNPGPILDTTREVYQRKLARLMRNEEYEEEDMELPLEGNYTNSPTSSPPTFASFTPSPRLNADDLRRRPLSRVEGEQWSDNSNLSPHVTWNPADIVTQVQPPPEEEKKSFLSSTTVIIIVAVIIFFFYMIYCNMESTPQNPFS